MNQKIDSILEGLSLEQRVAQLFIVTPEAVVDVGTAIQAGDQTAEALTRWPVGGLIYLGPNLIDPEQTRTMIENTIRFEIEATGIPPFICVDEEGGTVSRIGGTAGFGAVNVGDMEDIGATGDPAQAKSTAAYIAEYLKPLGFNTDFAPVCDIANNPDSDTMKQRSFGDNPELVSSMVTAQVEGFLENGLLCCAKHFPGIGAAVGDSHHTRIVSNQSVEELHEVELVPFKAAIQAGVPFIMVGHISVASVAGDDTPASLSSGVVQGLLREDLGYEGLIITDSLGMGAVSDYCNTEEAAARALEAGCDIALLPAGFDEAVNGVFNAINNGTLSEERIDQSVRRVLRTKLTLLGDLF